MVGNGTADTISMPGRRGGSVQRELSWGKMRRLSR